jgi:hypothetical protein
MNTCRIEALERRAFLSATPAVADVCPEVIDAEKALHAAVVHYRSDKRAGLADLADIRSDIRDAIAQLQAEKPDEVEAVIAPLREDLKAVLKDQAGQIRSARQDILDKRHEWAPVLEADVKAVLDAKAAGDEDALKDAISKIESDRSQFKADLVPLKQALADVYTQTRQAVSDARQAIEHAYAGLDDHLSDLFDNLNSTALATRSTLIADNAAVVSAQQSLHEAIEECRAEHGGEPLASS